MSKKIDYDAVRGRADRAPKRVAPLLFNAFYPLLIAVIFVVALSLFGYLKPQDLNLQEPMNFLMRKWLNWMK